MAGAEVRATSFGQVADDYDRLRPGPPAQALDWLVPPGCASAVDVAAGTGLFTRALKARVPDVTAVEPDERMRAVLAARTPGVRVVNGRGEDIPLPDASADAVFVSLAWHWLNPGQAVPEIARVLRDGGRLGVIWTMRDHVVDWVAALEPPREPVVPPGDAGRLAGGAEPRIRRRRHEVSVPEGAPFEHLDSATFPFTRTMTVDDAVAWLATYSRIITASGEQRAAALDRARRQLQERAAADGTVEIPMRADCWRADRKPR